jgi:serine phosphatase RsbU (regulator of sigma subunit)
LAILHALEREREQRTVAETLQAALLPGTLPELGAPELAVRYLPGVEGIHLGGDWFDVIATDDSHILVVLGDVSGRGLPAAAAMASLLYATRAYVAQGDPPGVIVTKLSRILSVERTGKFATVLLVYADLAACRMTVINAGHLPPLLLHGEGAEFIETHVGVPVGVSAEPSYTPITVPVSSGDTLLVFTDGLVERRGENLDVGLERLRDAAAFSDSPSLEGLVSDLVGSLVGEGTPDDTILLGLRWPS